ncbi:unnamed protein product [Brassica oleracea var. botrytis]|uniref:Uncharacterized protein n=2 Tax=Brassica TaxID=3705 RepID=A0A3P6E4T2_BRAOL|nr:unnamed protein product [Brassica napus]CDY16608.1 BnaC09g36650D [Brassica napus]VDD33016.1 unnamed protein product [Brassica oleracea]
MAPSFLGIAKFVEAILHRRFSSAGLFYKPFPSTPKPPYNTGVHHRLKTYRSRPSSPSTALAPPLYGIGTDR